MATPYAVRLLLLLALSALLAILTAAYGAMAGPLLRALFGGEGVVWPSSVASYLPPPPSVSELRAVIPWLIVGVASAKAVVQHVHSVSVVTLGERVKSDLRCLLHKCIMMWSPDMIRAQGVSDLTSRSTYDVDRVSEFVTDAVVAAARDGLQVVALVALCFAIDWRLALVAFCVYPLAFWPVVALGRRLRGRAGRTQERHADLLDTMDDHYRRAELYQLSDALGLSHRQYREANEDLSVATVDAERVKATASPLMELFGAVALAMGVVYTIARVDSASLAPELVMSFLAALLMLYQPAKKLARVQAVLEPARAAFERLSVLFQSDGRLPTGGDRSPPKCPEMIRASNISCRRGGRLVVDELSAVFLRGEVTAVLGANGSGKTTLAWLLSGLMTPDTGQIDVDGCDLQEMDLSAWRNRIGWVTQDCLLGSGTIRDNVLFGSELPELELKRAAELAGLIDVLERMPGGWSYELGEQGAGLSGGERQRVALCRALVRRPAILIMDEPTAGLDRLAVEALATQVASLKTECAVVLITHDPTMAAIADATVCLDRDSQAHRLAG